MAMATSSACVDQIGEAAGQVWQLINKMGPMSQTKVAKELGGPRDLAMQAIGWLAREGKVWIEDRGRVRIVGLR